VSAVHRAQALAALLGCTLGTIAYPGSGDPPPNVVALVIDTLRRIRLLNFR